MVAALAVCRIGGVFVVVGALVCRGVCSRRYAAACSGCRFGRLVCRIRCWDIRAKRRLSRVAVGIGGV